LPGPQNRLAAVFLTFLFFAQIPTAQATATQDFSSGDYALRAVTVASGLRHPWGMTFLPDGRMLVTEREGDIRIVTMAGDKSSPLKGLPDAYVSGQGGILDVASIQPFRKTNWFMFPSRSRGLGARERPCCGPCWIWTGKL
jgi:glucose/arabinose dehydrogenase